MSSFSRYQQNAGRTLNYLAARFSTAHHHIPRSVWILGGLMLALLLVLLLPNSGSGSDSNRNSESAEGTTQSLTSADEAVPPPVLHQIERSIDADALQPAEDADTVFTDSDSLLLPPAAIAESADTAPVFYVALIIDDLGNNAESGRRAVDLPAELTFAVLPHTPHGAMLADYAHQQGREVMLHIPMSNLAKIPLGPGALTEELEQEEFITVLGEALASIPNVQGLNNHMGSDLTAQKIPMQWLMQELKDQDLYFVDSMTTSLSVAGDTAEEFQVPHLRRQVFLDHEITMENISTQFERALSIARREGFAVAIGHPYRETLDFLEEALPRLSAEFKIIPVSEMLAMHQQGNAGVAAKVTPALEGTFTIKGAEPTDAL